jgi:ribose transport system substrate-binding protein
MRRSIGRSTRAYAVVGILSGLVLAATSAEDAVGRSPAAASNVSHATEPPNVRAARLLSQASMRAPAFKGPKTPVAMARIRGKSLWFISPTQANVYASTVAAGAQEAAKTAGLKMTVFDGKGSVAEYNKGMEEAITNRADGIILHAINPDLVSGPFEKARTAKIPMVDADNGDPGDALKPGLFAHVTAHYTGLGRVWARYIVWKSGGRPVHVEYFDDPNFPAEFKKFNGLSKELRRLCPTCTLHWEKIPITTLAQSLAGRVVNVLRRKPNTKWVIGGFGGTVRYITLGIRQARAVGKVRLISASAESQNLDAIRKGQILEADIGVPSSWLGWAEVDQLARAVASQRALAENVPLRLFTKANLPATNANLFGKTDFRRNYRKIWGLG